MKNKPQGRIARVTVVLVGILTFAGAANAARFETKFFDSPSAVSFGATFDSFNGAFGFYPNQAAGRNLCNVTRTSFNQAARISFKTVARRDCYEAPSVDKNVNKLFTFSSTFPASLGFSNSSRFDLAKGVEPRLQQTAVFNFGGTAKLSFNKTNKFTSTNLNTTAPQTGLAGFKPGFENSLI